MTVTQNEQLIINLGKGTRIFEKDHVKKALEAYEVKTGCANYERDNVLMSEMEQNIFDAMEKGICKDKIVESVRQKLLDRSSVGIKKYNTTIWDNIDENYIKHLQDELLDGANYCEQMLRLGEFTTNVSKILDNETNYYTIGELIVKEYNKLKQKK